MKYSREKLVDSMVGDGQYQKIRAQAATMVEAASKPTPTDRTVAAQVDAWKGLLRSACQSRQLSEGRYDAYCRRIGPFMEWVGPRSAIDDIDERKLEGYYGHLADLMTEGRYSPSSAHELMMTAKQFVSRLAALKLIPLPGNIRDRRFRFNHSVAAEIETFTVDEVRAFLAACTSERTKLYILLCLNCGQYQNDIAELRRNRSRGSPLAPGGLSW